MGSASPLKTRPPPGPQQGYSAGNAGTVNIDTGLLNSILDRLERLETSNHLPGNAEHRLSALEQTVEDTRRKAENSLTEVQDLQRVTMQLGNQMTRQGGLLEVLQQDVDSRRSVVSRMDSWARQGEIWRDDMEGQLASVNRQLKEVSRGVKEARERDGPSAGEFDTMREQLQLQTQQTVAANLGVWHDKMESSVRAVERQVAALRIGATVSGSGSVELSEGQVREAMSTQQPSELLVKAMVDSALRDVEKELESSVTGRVRADLKSEQVDNLRNIKTDLQGLVNQMAIEAGLAVKDGEGGTSSTKDSLARQSTASRKAQERELELMSSKCEDISAAVAMLQESVSSNEKHHANELRALERRMDESVTISSSNVSTVQARSAGLEELVRNAELAQRTALQVQREELMERVREAASSWSGDRSSLDRRLLMVEKTSEDLVERLKMSTSAIEAFFTSSAEGRRLQAAAAKTELLAVEVNNFRTEVRDATAVVTRLDAQAARKNEFAELRDRISVCELVGDVVKRLDSKTAKEAEDISGLQGKIAGLEAGVAGQQSASRAASERTLELESSVAEVSSHVKGAEETASMLGMRLNQLDAALRDELRAATKENTSAAARVDQVEARVQTLSGANEQALEAANSSLQRLQTAHAGLEGRVDTLSSRVGQMSSGPATAHAASPSHHQPPLLTTSSSAATTTSTSATLSARQASPKVPAKPHRAPSPLAQKPAEKGEKKEHRSSHSKPTRQPSPLPAVTRKERRSPSPAAATGGDDSDEEFFSKASSVANNKNQKKTPTATAAAASPSGRKSPPVPPKPTRKSPSPAPSPSAVSDAGSEDSFSPSPAPAPAPTTEEKQPKEANSAASTPFADLSSASAAFDGGNNVTTTSSSSSNLEFDTSVASTAFGSLDTPSKAGGDAAGTVDTDDDDGFAPSPAPAPSTEVKDKKKKPAMTVPALDLGGGGGSKEPDALHEPPPKRREDRDTSLSIAAAAADKPSKPSKPSKPAKTASGASTPRAVEAETPSSSAAAAAAAAGAGAGAAGGGGDTSKMSIKERLKQRIEQKKAAKPAKPAKSPTAAAKSPSGDSVHSFGDSD
jgi:hypothetical protein